MKDYLDLIKRKITGRMTSDEFIDYLRERGVRIGENVVFIYPKNTGIDVQAGFLISIGDNVTITPEVLILAHDFSYSVLNDVYKIMPQNHRETKIGNNVFIGMKAVILMGTEIGDNCIIGAGSVVSGKIPSGTVWAGNPARQICTLEDYKKKREAHYHDGAVCLAKGIIERFHRKPTYKEMGAYIGLFAPRTEEYRKYFMEISRLPMSGENVWNFEPQYEDLDDFLKKNGLM
ncbi:acyltransferase [Butyrivibrio sp. AE3006]|uniref:acyltransferase n=1 Tax=Butyrivibrio sp. AE3006 TaxID=1280673 RepID=UPI000401BA5F|nr:acyltransferase [Butyrivibrio sp. AE3006]